MGKHMVDLKSFTQEVLYTTGKMVFGWLCRWNFPLHNLSPSLFSNPFLKLCATRVELHINVWEKVNGYPCKLGSHEFPCRLTPKRTFSVNISNCDDLSSQAYLDSKIRQQFCLENSLVQQNPIKQEKH